ncbi:MAG: outer membrane protein transport protein [Hyphomicrobiaceae bacterium]|nr:outer membrane protein transport protein [Hyphomicrobiaceae bacterium]
MAMMFAAACAFAVPANATEGYAAVGFGARHKALAGAGAADSRDATAASLNPAGLVHVGNEMSMSFSAFAPFRQFETDGPGPFLPPGQEVSSDKNLFFVPNVAMSTTALKNPMFDVIAFTMVGNGGMNTSYPSFANADCPLGTKGTGAFCMGPAGVNLLQMVMSVAVAKQIAPGISVGIAPMMALQGFQAHGLEAFSAFSVDPANMDSYKRDWTYGFGVRGGIEIAPMQNVRLGITGNTPIWSENFGKYSGLFAEGGNFDIPASMQIGIAVDMNPQLTFMLDWRHIWFSSTDSVGNPSTNLLMCAPASGNPYCFGGAKGAGFGWKDLDAIKFGVEYRARPSLTLRAGYAWNTQPVRSRDAMLNVLAPAVSQHHITGGLEYDLGGGYHLELAGMFSPSRSVTGPNLFNPIAFNGIADFDQNIKDTMWQMEATVGIKYLFGEADAPLK